MQNVQIEIGGKTYRLATLDRELSDRFLAWADSVLPSPLSIVAKDIAAFPEHLQKQLMTDALSQSKVKRSFHSPEVQSLMSSSEGAAKLIGLILRKHQPELASDDAAFDVFLAGIEEHGDEVMQSKLKEATRQK